MVAAAALSSANVDYAMFTSSCEGHKYTCGKEGRVLNVWDSIFHSFAISF